jgi:hypothetical protein
MISRPCEGHTRGCDITHHTKSRPKSVISQVCAICDAFHQRQREKATAALGLLSSRPPGLPPTALLPPPPPASLIPPLTASFGAENVTMSARVDKREAAQVGADKTPTKPEETNAAEDESRANERSSSERKKTRGKPLFSDVTRGGPSRSDSGS